MERNAFPPPEPASLRVNALSVRYARAAAPILDGVELTVEPGEAVGLLGRSGRGKTSLLHAVAGLVPWLTPAEVDGEIAIDGESLTELDPGQRSRLIATCLDRPEAQLFLATVRQEIDAAARLYGDVAMAEEAVEALGIGPLLERRVTELSSGERQRAALAVALAGCPRPILLDEPTAHLDTGAETALVELLQRLRQRGAPLVVTEQAPWRVAAAVSGWRALAGGRLSEVAEPPAPSVPPPAHEPGDRRLLTCHGVAVARGERRLISGFDLDLHEGEVVLLTGPNGSGKSTLAEVLAGLRRPAGGEIGTSGRVGLMLPEAELQLFASTVAGEVSMAAPGHGERARVLRRHGLEHLAARAPWSLSRGEQQRLVHAALDLLRMEVMIIDEPSQGLDPEDLQAFLELVGRRSAKGRAYLIISHRPEIAAVAHRRVEVRDGRVEEVPG